VRQAESGSPAVIAAGRRGGWAGRWRAGARDSTWLLAYDGQYISQELRVRSRDFHAVDTVTPFLLELTWEQLDDGL